MRSNREGLQMGLRADFEQGLAAGLKRCLQSGIESVRCVAYAPASTARRHLFGSRRLAGQVGDDPDPRRMILHLPAAQLSNSSSIGSSSGE